MNEKEKNFISAVGYLGNTTDTAIKFCEKLLVSLDKHFEKYEVILVENACSKEMSEKIREYAKNQSKPLTFLHMSLQQTKEMCMNAALDAAIGDYVYEFETTDMPYNEEEIFKAYELSQTGNDIVSAVPEKTGFLSSVFYKIFNSYSNSAYPIHTDLFRLVSRRAINRVHASSAYLPYRKAAYAASGLKMAQMKVCEKIRNNRGDRFNLAVDSLLLYTNAGFKFSIFLALLLFVTALLELIYVITIYINGHPIEGWTTTMFVITFGFTGFFFFFSIIIKYLALFVDITFKQQKYLIESIEKIQK